MLSPSDFIFNEFSSPPVYFLETQHTSKPNTFRQYLPTISKTHNPYTGAPPHMVNLDNNTIFEIIKSHIDNIQLNSSQLKVDDIYFPGVRFVSEGMVVFERPPSYQVIDIDNDYRDNIRFETTTSQYYIPLPWQVYVCTYNPADMRLVGVRMFFAESSLTHIDQTVYCPPMFNFYSNGNLCRPFFASMDDIEKYPQNISGVIASAFDWVWNSGFNFDITENIAQFLSSQKFEEFAPWAEISAPNSLRFLRDNRIYGLPRLTHKSYFESFFKCWESIPLDQVSSIKWSNYTKAEFYYIEIANASQEFFDQYLFDNDISLCECDCDDEECYSDDCYSEEQVKESSDYQDALAKANLISEKSISNAVNDVAKYLKDAKIISKIPDMLSFTQTFSNIYEEYLSKG